MRHFLRNKGGGKREGELYISKFFLVQPKIMADFMQEGITDLLHDLRFVRANSLNVLLVQEDVIRRISGKDALQGPWNA